MKHLIRFFTLMACLFVLALAAYAQEPTVEVYDISCQVEDNGRWTATLRLEMSFPDGVTEVTLPLPQGGERVRISGVSSSLAAQEDGTLLLTLAKPDGFSPQEVFTITWRMPAQYTDDVSATLTLPLLSSRWSWDIGRFTYAITLPKDVPAEPVYESGYHGTLTQQDAGAAVSGTQITGTLPEGLMAYDSFSVAVALPAGFFKLPGVLIRYLCSAPGIFNLLALGLTLWATAYWFTRCRLSSLRIRSRPLPPDGACAGDLPFFLSGDRPDAAALLLDWAAAGYVSLHRKDGRTLIRRRMHMGNERQDYELHLFSNLFDSYGVCSLPSKQAARLFGQAEKEMRRAWRRRLFDSRRRGAARRLRLLSALGMGVAGVCLLYGLPWSGFVRMFCSLLGFIPFSLAALYLQSCAMGRLQRPWLPGAGVILVAILALGLSLAGFRVGCWTLLPAAAWQAVAGMQTAFGDPRTRSGREALRQLLCFRTYLLTVSQEDLRSALRQDPMYFYRLLPWAQALGLGRSFARRFGRLTLESADYYATGRESQTALVFYDSIVPVLEALPS